MFSCYRSFLGLQGSFACVVLFYCYRALLDRERSKSQFLFESGRLCRATLFSVSQDCLVVGILR